MNTQITEDYCSFEVAKLLKDKGFDEQCTYMYNSQHKLYSTFEQCKQITRNNSDWINCVGQLNVVPIAVPTLQMAMKWLRDVHNIFIEINIIPHTTVTMEQEYYFFKSYKDRRPHNFPLNFSVKLYSSYEEACEAAIKYCLTNLI